VRLWVSARIVVKFQQPAARYKKAGAMLLDLVKADTGSAMSALGQKRRFVMYAVCPLYPQHRAFQVPVSTSQEGQDRLLNGYGARFDASCIWRLMRLSYGR